MYSWSAYIDEKDQLTGEFLASPIQGKVYSTLSYQDFIGNASCCLIRRACFEKIGGYNDQLIRQNAQGGEDLEIYLRIAEYYEFRVIPEFLVGYRKHSNSMSCDYRSMAKSRFLIWESIQQKYPDVSVILQRLSSVSFYLYLARQSSANGEPVHTFTWLRQALKADFITIFLRPGFYILLTQSAVQILIQGVGASLGIKQFSWIAPKRKNIPAQEVMTIADLQQKKASIFLRILTWNLLHQAIPLLFGTPEKWKKNEASFSTV